MMKLMISVMAAVGLGVTCTAFADKYSQLAEQGYRWVTVDGPYACTSEQNVERMVGHRTDASELEVVENILCYYLIPGTIVEVIKEDRVRGISEVRLGSVVRPLWTYTRFLSKHPVQDTYGITETPENSGLMPEANPAGGPLRSDKSTPEF
jgi:hypothetical protein